jgi:hypothetical protein
LYALEERAAPGPGQDFSKSFEAGGAARPDAARQQKKGEQSPVPSAGELQLQDAAANYRGRAVRVESGSLPWNDILAGATATESADNTSDDTSADSQRLSQQPQSRKLVASPDGESSAPRLEANKSNLAGPSANEGKAGGSPAPAPAIAGGRPAEALPSKAVQAMPNRNATPPQRVLFLLRVVPQPATSR